MTLPNEMRVVVERLPAEAQSMVRLEYKRRKKSKTFAYFAWFFLGWHYLYLRRVGLQIAFWVTLGGAGIWWLVDLFRVWGLVDRLNEDTARDLIVQYKSIYGDGHQNVSPTMVNVYSLPPTHPQPLANSSAETRRIESDMPAEAFTDHPGAIVGDIATSAVGRDASASVEGEPAASQPKQESVGSGSVGGGASDIVESLRQFGYGKAALGFGAIVLVGILAGVAGIKLYKSAFASSKEGVVATLQLNCRSEPTPQSSIVDRFSQGAKVKVLEEAGGWSKIAIENGFCWSRSSYISLGGGS